MAYSDEPVLVRPARRPIGRWLAIGGTLLVLASVAYIPWQSHHMDELAHDATRGSHGGTAYDVTFGGATHNLEIYWVRGPVFAVACTPPAPAGSSLRVEGRFGADTLPWDEEQKAFGPGQTTVSPRDHYKLKLTLLGPDGSTLWSGTRWAYGVVDDHHH